MSNTSLLQWCNTPVLEPRKPWSYDMALLQTLLCQGYLTCTSESASTCWSWNQVSLLWYFCRSSFWIATFPGNKTNQKHSLRHAIAPLKYISIKNGFKTLINGQLRNASKQGKTSSGHFFLFKAQYITLSDYHLFPLHIMKDFTIPSIILTSQTEALCCVDEFASMAVVKILLLLWHDN